ncbi:MAG: hypothetical protein KIH62_000890 [Candidatus Kerfeldbacteria bacterium]|nr:hypothetical protein [Candidatus Kerfeldbacteria bacterium]
MSQRISQQPEQSATPQERRKFWILVGLSGVLIVLFWVATLPLSSDSNNGPAGPATFFQKIGQQISLSGLIFKKAGEVQNTLNDPQ